MLSVSVGMVAVFVSEGVGWRWSILSAIDCLTFDRWWAEFGSWREIAALRLFPRQSFSFGNS